MDHLIKINGLAISKNGPFFLIAGPCVIENEKTILDVAHFLKKTCAELDIPVVFKTSYDKANRTSIRSFRGPGMETGLQKIQQVKEETGLPVLSDVHQPSEVAAAAEVLDVIQIPALLCRQTDLLLEAAKTGLPINIKKGQFLSPWDMENAVNKITSVNNHGIMLTERGSSFGYNNLVVDIRSIAICTIVIPVKDTYVLNIPLQIPYHQMPCAILILSA